MQTRLQSGADASSLQQRLSGLKCSRYQDLRRSNTAMSYELPLPIIARQPEYVISTTYVARSLANQLPFLL
jgi:hypothetical protein